MNKISLHKFYIALILTLPIFLFVSLPCSAQQISLANGTLPDIGENTEVQIDNPLSDDITIILTPKTGHKIAKVTINNDTTTSRIFGNKITYKMKNEYLLVNDNAKIVWGDDILTGPVKIEFDPVKNLMTLSGTTKHPAEINSSRMGTILQAEKWFMEFSKPKNGKRDLKKITSVNFIQQIPITPKKATTKDTKFKPKTSGPKK
jgi:hypothetical protein